jgi:cytochrome c oxidase subunit 2
MLWAGFISLAWILFVIFAPIAPWFHEASTQAAEVDWVFKFMLAAGGAITILVQVLLVAFVIRYRSQQRHPDDELGVQMHGNTRLEMVWTAAPALLLVVLLVVSMRVWGDEHTRHSDELDLGVNGFQYGWNFDLPQYGIKGVDPVYIPVNRPVYVAEHSPDVIHSFWVPEFRIKQDVVPGITTHEIFTPDRIGTYRVICTEYCGNGHSTMHTTLRVASQADFEKWVVAHGGKLPAGSTTTAQVISR